ncbi:MAG: rhodanese-like domain-containing protein [Candidatus Omnitrophica bacterium]|nr:rhodanese-like domain-containing protein [Candidatus Omnitrophota bacterium]
MNLSFICRWLCCSSFAFGTMALAVSPDAVQQKLSAGVKLTFIDVRSTAIFKNGHIPGAINVPAALVPEKQLPPLGRVVVYDNGLGVNTADAAATALNQKPGISAEVLDGGFAAWETAQAPTTKPAGLGREEAPLISYQDLKKAINQDVVLVDLRKKNIAVSTLNAPKTTQPPLTDLQAEFPGAHITRSPFSLPAARKSASGDPGPPPLLVLIDNGDGAAFEMARTLKANGIRRFVILAGGEDILARKGQPGLERAGSTITLRGTIVPSVTNNNR